MERPTLPAAITDAVVGWRADYTALGPDPMALAHPRVTHALSVRVANAVQAWLRERRDEEIEELEASIDKLEAEAGFMEGRQGETEAATLAELREAYAILGVMAQRSGGSVRVTGQERTVARTLTVEITQDDTDGTVEIKATDGNSPVGTVVGSDSDSGDD